MPSYDLALISLPFYPAFCANYAIEYLRAVCELRGVKTCSIHAHFPFGRRLIEKGQHELYKELKSTRYFGAYLVLARNNPDLATNILEELSKQIGLSFTLDEERLITFFTVFNQIIDESIQRIQTSRASIVGISATHYQLVTSLYFARRLKEELPHIKIILGGYLSSLETCYDLLRLHPYVDIIIYGEGEQRLPSLVAELKEKNIARCVLRGGYASRLPTLPQFDDFFLKEVAHQEWLPYSSVGFEISRGCYWDRCDFCNFNVAYGKFRKFEVRKVLDEMERLYEIFGVRRFHLLDTSLPPLFAKACLSRGSIDWDVFVEIMIDWKVDSLKSLRKFGVSRAQVGIESFSTQHLYSMNKRATVEQNISCLEACFASGITPVYGLLINRPGDIPAYYQEAIKVMSKIDHLTPPKYVSFFDLRPGSPIFENRRKMGAKISFFSGAFDQILPPLDHNCELRPSKVLWPTLLNEELQNARIELELAVAEWQNSWIKKRS